MHLDMAAQKERDDQEKMVANSLKREEDFRNLASENEALKAELTKVKSRYKVREITNAFFAQFMPNLKVNKLFWPSQYLFFLF